MEFKKADFIFERKDQFGNDMRRFVSDEAAKFTTGGNEAASASIDETVERGFRFSKETSKGKIREQKRILLEIKKKKDELFASESIDPSEEKIDSPTPSHSKNEKESKASSHEGKKEKETKQFVAKENTAKKTKSKETKKAAAKTALTSVFQAKKEISNGLVSDKVTGDALKDGNSGMIRVMTEVINPMRYVKSLCAKILAVILPYILGFMAVFSILLIIIAFLFSVLQPLAAVGDALHSFVSLFTNESTFVNSTLSEEEIEEIVAAAGVDETQEAVIRYVLSKVGYPYSQENRSSGTAYDCSSLAYYAWESAGVDIGYELGYPPSAAEGARMLEADGKSLETMALEPGDLIYYGGEGNGRYLGIYHVAVYVGNGKAVEALNTQYGVVYQNLRINNAIMVCRPN